jgi:hypothetical protein
MLMREPPEPLHMIEDACTLAALEELLVNRFIRRSPHKPKGYTPHTASHLTGDLNKLLPILQVVQAPNPSDNGIF